MNRTGLTIIESIITLAITVLLSISVTVVFIACFKAYNSSQDRNQIRTQLSQAMDLMARQIYNAQSISTCSSSTLTFYGDLGSGAATYSYSISGTNLLGTTGAVIAANISSGSFDCTTTANTVIIDMTATKNSGLKNAVTVRIKTSVMPRNLVVYGLIAHWKMDDGSSGACSGATVTDSSGNGYTGTCNSSPTWITGQLDNALSFNGSSSYVSIADNSALRLPGDFTISVWGKSTAAQKVFQVSKKSTSYNQANGWQFYHEAAGSALDLVGASASYLRATKTIDGGWHHYLVTMSSGTATIYYDGVSQVSGAVNAPTGDTDEVRIGRRGGAGTQVYADGSIDDVRIYNRVLSATEISQLYNGISG